MTAIAPRDDSDAPLLSICIPTYNRAGELGNLLNSIAAQTHPLSIEVRVRDNASQDGTREVFERFAAGRANWHYERNERNLGGRANIGLCAENAIGRFIHIVGDDDHFAPDGFFLLDRLLAAARDAGAAAIFGCARLGPEMGGVVLEGGFEWLRYVSINTPAFVSSVIWSPEFWRGYGYFDYPPEMSLPQLDCFVSACMTRKVVVSNRDLVVRGDCEPTDKKTFWFYARNPLLDAFEYPTLYKKVLASNRIASRMRIWIEARRFWLLQRTIKQTLFIHHNRHYYHPTMEQFRRAHGGTYYWPFLRIVLATILGTRFGSWVAAWYCTRIARVEDLPPQAARPQDF